LQNEKTVYVIGVFDLFHRGHVELLKKARALGDKLIVAINGDNFTAKYKRPPIYCEDDRLAIISSSKYVDESFVIDQYDNKEVIIEHDIDIIVHGNDWDLEGYKEQIRVDDAFLKEHDVELLMLEYTEGISTSGIIEKIKQSR
jgi:glycerol-3-phosphate cytidylyltransferase